MSFDPANPPDKSLATFQKRSVEMYQKLLDRGDEETAEELRHHDSPSRQARFIRQNVVEFDPKHDDDIKNSARMKTKNVYEALVDLGRDDLAEELRTVQNVQPQKERAIEIAKKEVDAQIDMVTGDVEPATEIAG